MSRPRSRSDSSNPARGSDESGSDDSDAMLHSSDDEFESNCRSSARLVGTGGGVSSINALLGRPERVRHSAVDGAGSLNDHSPSVESKGWCARNAAFVAIGLVVLLLVGLFVNIHFKVGPSAPRRFLGLPTHEPGEAVAVSVADGVRTRLEQRMRVDRVGGTVKSLSSVVEHGEHDLPHDLSARQLRSQASRLSQALNNFGIGGPVSETDGPPLPVDAWQLPPASSPGDDPDPSNTAVPDVSDLEAELKLTDVDDLAARMEAARVQMAMEHEQERAQELAHEQAKAASHATPADTEEQWVRGLEAVQERARLAQQKAEAAADHPIEPLHEENSVALRPRLRQIERRPGHREPQHEPELEHSPPSLGRQQGSYAVDALAAAAARAMYANSTDIKEAQADQAAHLDDHIEEEAVQSAPKLEAPPSKLATTPSQQQHPPPPPPKPVQVFNFADRSLLPFALVATPLLAGEPFCPTCLSHCANVVSSMMSRSSHLAPADRALKLAALGVSGPEGEAAFFRGTPHRFWQALMHPSSKKARAMDRWTDAKATTFLSADLHLANYGAFDAPGLESRHVPFGGFGHKQQAAVAFGLNDFDQAFVGSLYWADLVRTMSSMLIGMGSSHRTVGRLDRHQMTNTLSEFAHTYHKTVSSFVGNDRELTSVLSSVSGPLAGPVRRLVHKSARHTRRAMLDKFAPIGRKSGQRRLKHSKLATPTTQETEALREAWSRYLRSLGVLHRAHMRRSAVKSSPWHSRPFSSVPFDQLNSFYAIKSIARRVGAGLASMGTPRFFVLVEGPTKSPDDDVILDVKREDTHAEWAPFLGQAKQEANDLFASPAIRAAAGASAFAALGAEDVHLGFVELGPSSGVAGSYLVRSRSPNKGALSAKRMTHWSARSWVKVGRALGRTLAGAHARADDDYDVRLVPTSFELGFTQLVPASDLHEWTDALISLARSEARRSSKDATCWRVHHALAEATAATAAATAIATEVTEDSAVDQQDQISERRDQAEARRDEEEQTKDLEAEIEAAQE